MLSLALIVLALVAAPTAKPAAVEAGGAKRVYYEVRTPVGRPHGVVLAFHGGGWCGDSGPGARECGPPETRMRDDQADGTDVDLAGGRVFTEAERDAVTGGYIVVGATYATDEPGLADVLAFYDQAAARWPEEPIFAWGQSAGAQWALVLGTRRPLDGIVGEGTPADFATWARGGQGAVFVNDALPVVFGARTDPAPNLDNYDPGLIYPRADGPPVLLITGQGTADPVVHEPVARAFARRVESTRVRAVSAGESQWIHGKVDPQDLQRARNAALAFLDAQASG